MVKLFCLCFQPACSFFPSRCSTLSRRSVKATDEGVSSPRLPLDATDRSQNVWQWILESERQGKHKPHRWVWVRNSHKMNCTQNHWCFLLPAHGIYWPFLFSQHSRSKEVQPPWRQDSDKSDALLLGWRWHRQWGSPPRPPPRPSIHPGPSHATPAPAKHPGTARGGLSPARRGVQATQTEVGTHSPFTLKPKLAFIHIPYLPLPHLIEHIRTDWKCCPVVSLHIDVSIN